MKAQELRLGNYINEIGVDFDYNGNKIDDGTFEVIKVDIDVLKDILECWEVYYKPIPLTKEWLIKLGFSYAIGWDDFEYLHKDGVHIYFCNDGTNKWFEYEMEFKVKSIHQLQNLHFALTGIELI